MDKEHLIQCGIDYNKGILFFGKDQKLYEKYIEEFAYQTLLEDATEYLKNDNVQGAFAAIHKLKSLVEYIQIPKADEMVHELTETLRKGKTDGVLDGIAYLNMIFDEIKEVIQKELE